MARLYRGQDRRTLKKAKQAIELLQARDLIALNPAKTAKISTRVEVFPVANTALTAHVTAVLTQLTAKLNA